MSRSFSQYLAGVNRFFAWRLPAPMPVVIITGHGISGDYARTRAIASAQLHSTIHKAVVRPTVVALAIHAGISICLAFRRWRRA